MADVYTPTKTLDGTPFSQAETPEVYVPTRIAPTPDRPTSLKQVTDIRQKYGVQAGEAYSPSNPGIRIVKRKPKPSTENEAALGKPIAGKRPAPEDDVAIAALRTQPKKGILRDGQQLAKRQNRRIFFADTRGFPLEAIKEIEKIAAIHSSSHDFRSFERNEGLGFSREPIPDEPDWGLLHVKRSKPIRTELSETGRREEVRIKELGLLRGAMFGVCTLEDDPMLTELAKRDVATAKPIIIPTTSVTSEHSVINTLRELPLPGRGRASEMDQQYHQHNRYEQVSTATGSNIYQATMAEKPPVIQQIFSETETPSASAYYATTEPEKPEPKPTSKFELPANLREMLNQLKKKGFVSSEDSNTTPAPTTTAPLAAAMQTAKQMYEQTHQNTYDSAPPEYQGYIGNFATPEMSAQELRQDSRNSEGWTRSQSDWRIQEPCSYHINRLSGCNRGDQCRYLHDDELRQRNLANHQGGRGGFQRDHDDRGFRNDRGGRRGNFRGGFRNNHQDRDFRDRQGYRDRFQKQDRFNNYRDNFGRGGFNQRPQVESYAQEQPQPSQASPEYQASQQEQAAGFSGYQAQMAAPAQAAGTSEEGFKPMRRSRFDQRDNSVNRDVDHRQQRRNRFDEEPAQPRSFRSRFDEGPKDQDDRSAPVQYQAQWAPSQ